MLLVRRIGIKATASRTCLGRVGTLYPLISPWILPLQQGFHSSPIVEMGRRTGSSAFDQGPRRFSKAQMRRRAAEREREKQKVDPKAVKKKALKGEQLKTQMATPEFGKFIEESEKVIEEMLANTRPEGILQLEQKVAAQASIDSDKKRTMPREELHSKLRLIMYSSSHSELRRDPGDDSQRPGLVLMGTSQADIVSKEIEETVTASDLQVLAEHLTERKTFDLSEAKEVLKYAKEIGKPVENYLKVLDNMLSHPVGKMSAQEMFDYILSMGVTPDAELWARQCRVVCQTQGADAGLKLMEKFYNMDMTLTASMYEAVLEEYINKKRYEDAKKLFTTMHGLGAPPPTSSFNLMLRKCRENHEAELSRHYVDEMLLMGTPLDEQTYYNFILASGEAPHWVHGFEDFIYESILKMEGQEFVPTEKIYRAILAAFGRARDAKAVEFYFWEMRHKGLKVTPLAYELLLLGYAREQSVGHPSYGTDGRYTRKPEKPLTPIEQAIVDVGPVRAAQLMTQGMYMEGAKERGSRQHGKLEDMMDDEEFSDATYEQLMREAEDSPAALHRLALEVTRKKKEKFDREFKIPPDLLEAAESEKLASTSSAESEDSTSPNLIGDILAKGLKLQNVVADIKRTLPRDSTKYQETSFLDPFRKSRGVLGLHRDSHGNPVLPTPTTVVPVASQSAKVGDSLASILDAGAMKYVAENESDRNRDVRQPRTEKQKLKFDAEFYNKKEKQLGKSSENLLKIAKADDTGPLFQSQNQEEDGGKGVTVRGVLEWSMVEFGTPPTPTYHLVPLRQRMADNCHRAELAMNDMLANGLIPRQDCMVNYLLVFAEALNIEKSIFIFEQLPAIGYAQDAKSYCALIRMFIRAKDVNSALVYKTKMQEKGLSLDGSTYGHLVQTLSHRDEMLPESLLMLEEAASKGIVLEDKYVRHLRSRCRNLGLKHVDIPADPFQWLHDKKKMRFQKRHSTKRRVQLLTSKLYR